MKKSPIFLFLLLFLCVGAFQSCKDEEGEPDGPGSGNPTTTVPDELVGYWQAGSFSMSSFSNYDGSYAGQAYEIATGYQLHKNGTAEEYFYYTSTSYYCREQILGYRKGTVEIDPENKTIKFYAASGNYRRYDSCGSSQSPGYGETKPYGPEDLYPEHQTEYSDYSLVQENGKAILRIPYSDGSTLEFEKTSSPK